MKCKLSFYASLLPKLSILITTFTSWIVSVRWRPLLSKHSPKRFWKFCITRCSMLWEISATSSLVFCFKSTVVLGFFSYTLLFRYPQRKKYCDYGHSFRWILKCRRNILWVKTESSFFKYVSTAKTRCSTDQRSMATEMLWVSLEEHPRTNSPRQRFHSQLFCKILRYFCRTLYLKFHAEATCAQYWVSLCITSALPPPQRDTIAWTSMTQKNTHTLV